MKRILLTLIFFIITFTPIFAYGNTKILQLHFIPEFQINDKLTTFNTKASISTNFNFGYKESWGLYLDLNIGSQIYQIKNSSVNKTKEFTYDFMLGLSYMAKLKKNNTIYGLVSIGAVAKKSQQAVSNSFIDFTIGTAIYADIEKYFTNNTFVSIGGRIDYNFLEIFSKNTIPNLLSTNFFDYALYLGLGFSWNR